MRILKRLIPNNLRQKLRQILVYWRQTPLYRNRFVSLGGRMNGYRIQGGLLPGFLDGTYENDLCEIIEKYLKPGMTCADVGAHVGYMTLLMASRVGREGRVFAFEAYPSNAAYIVKNAATNGLSQCVIVENKAVSDGKDSVVKLRFGRDRSTAEWNIARDRHHQGIPVQALSLDGYFEGASRLDFIKMDIEGAEEFALTGMAHVLKVLRPVMCIEFHHEAAWAQRKILLQANYVLYNIQKREWVTANESAMVYHILAVPSEKRATIVL
jgi:FkbM family methyltransferase